MTTLKEMIDSINKMDEKQLSKPRHVGSFGYDYGIGSFRQRYHHKKTNRHCFFMEQCVCRGTSFLKHYGKRSYLSFGGGVKKPGVKKLKTLRPDDLEPLY